MFCTVYIKSMYVNLISLSLNYSHGFNIASSREASVPFKEAKSDATVTNHRTKLWETKAWQMGTCTRKLQEKPRRMDNVCMEFPLYHCSAVAIFFYKSCNTEQLRLGGLHAKSKSIFSCTRLLQVALLASIYIFPFLFRLALVSLFICYFYFLSFFPPRSCSLYRDIAFLPLPLLFNFVLGHELAYLLAVSNTLFPVSTN